MNQSKIKLNNSKDQIELFKMAVSSDAAVAEKAKNAIAGFIGPMIQQVLNLQGQAKFLYEDWQYSADNNPTIPLDPYYGLGVGAIKCWSQTQAGGLGTTTEGLLRELQIATYRLDSACYFENEQLRKALLPHVAATLNRMAQEILRMQERNAWIVALRALAEGRTNGAEHLINNTTADILQLDDFNRMITLSKRMNTAWDGGTPDEVYTRGATDWFMSPEMIEQIRGFAYNPMNTRAVPNTDESTAVPLPEAMRAQIYQNAGLTEIYGVTIHELLEFGTNRRYNNMFATLYSTAGGALTFNTANQELVLGVDRSRGVLLRPVKADSETGSTFTTQVDDQWPKRAERTGFYGSLREGRVVLDARALTGLIIQ